MDGQPQFDISRLSASDRNELNQFLQNETQKSSIQQSASLYKFFLLVNRLFPFLDVGCESPNDADPNPIPSSSRNALLFIKQANIYITAVHHLTEVCFKKCVTSRITTNKLAPAEESCAQNCVNRWMDANLAIVKHLDNLRQ